MQLLEITITGIGPILLSHGIVGAIAFVGGILVYKNRSAKLEARITALEALVKK
jgi:hypothetical protein